MTSTSRHEHWCGWLADDPRWDDERATIDYGAPRPAVVWTPPPPPVGQARLLRRRVLVGAGVLLLVIGVIAWGNPGSNTSERHPTLSGMAAGGDISDAERPAAAARDCSATTTTSPAAPIPDNRLPPDVLTYAVDLDDCARTIRYDRQAGLLTVGGLGTYAVGAPGDWLGVGDWNCDGTPTPALYRPSSGEVFRFLEWAGEDALESEPPTIETRRGEPQIIEDGECDRLVVHSVPSGGPEN